MIERLRDGDRARTRGEHAEDALDDGCFRGIDCPLATNKLPTLIGAPHDVVAVAPSACRLPSLYASTLPTVGLLRQVLEEQGVHRALQADMQLGDLALGKGDDPDPGELHPLEQSGDILLIARQTVQGLSDDDVEGAAPRVLDQRLIPRPNCRRSADGRIAVDVNERPVLRSNPLLAQPDLVIDRGLVLALRGIPGIDDRAQSHSLCSIHDLAAEPIRWWSRLEVTAQPAALRMPPVRLGEPNA